MPSKPPTILLQTAASIAMLSRVSPPGTDIPFERMHAGARNNEVAYGQSIIGPQFQVKTLERLTRLRRRGLITVDFAQETFQITPSGNTVYDLPPALTSGAYFGRRFTRIQDDAAVTPDLDDEAVVLSYFYACSKHFSGLKSVAKSQQYRQMEQLQKQIQKRQVENGELRDQVKSLQKSNPASGSGSEYISKHTTPRTARAEKPYQLLALDSTPKAPSGHRLLASPSSPSPRGTGPMDVDEDEDKDDKYFLMPRSSFSLFRTNSAMTIDQPENPYQLLALDSTPKAHSGHRFMASPSSPSPRGTGPMDVDEDEDKDDKNFLMPRSSFSLSRTNSALTTDLDQPGGSRAPDTPEYDKNMTTLKTELQQSKDKEAGLEGQLKKLKLQDQLNPHKATIKEFKDQITKLESQGRLDAAALANLTDEIAVCCQMLGDRHTQVTQLEADKKRLWASLESQVQALQKTTDNLAQLTRENKGLKEALQEDADFFE
ncbi:hypothetical protein C8F04DRAFT_1261147 [Mycena alexandri]|uniref:Uncharacterized protein n=1 Tax=Mycena alexandri TaxID=1745969 RepID=A0AAD6X1P0_9AGAR|nr:hypothetical protein C8F04DRAFT_1261147 [Mycena alexandri]